MADALRVVARLVFFFRIAPVFKGAARGADGTVLKIFLTAAIAVGAVPMRLAFVVESMRARTRGHGGLPALSSPSSTFQ